MPEQDIGGWTTTAVMTTQAAKYGEREFCTFDDGGTLSFQAFEAQTNRLASAFAEIGVGPGDCVMAMLHNGMEILLSMIAAHKRGAIFVPVNIDLRGAFLEHQVRTITPKMVILDEEFLPVFEALSCREANIQSSVIVGESRQGLSGTAVHAFDALLAVEAKTADLVSTTRHDVCLILFTSGTTGPSKGVMLPHTLCYIYALGAMGSTHLCDKDRMHISMPLFHGTALLLQFYSALLSGAAVHVARRFSASTWLADIRRTGSTVTYAVGVMPEFIFRQPERDDDADNSLRLIWSVPVAERWGSAFEKRFGLKILQGYGMTEFGICVWGNVKDPVTPGCAGRPFDEFYEVRVVDPDSDEPLGPGAIGEIVVRPKVPSGFMAGYYRMPEESWKASRNLWFHSGDAGYLDENGQLFYVDRIKDRIRRRGENISAYEVEQVLNGHEDVLESAVVGIKVEGAGGEDEVMAYVVPRSREIDPIGVLDWCVPRMPRYAVPRFLEFVSDIERTPSGKIRKQALRDAGVKGSTWDREAAGYEVPRSGNAPGTAS